MTKKIEQHENKYIHITKGGFYTVIIAIVSAFLFWPMWNFVPPDLEIMGLWGYLAFLGHIFATIIPLIVLAIGLIIWNE